MRHASNHLTPITLELGGKSPCIVHKSADIRLAAKRIVFGKFLNCGQTCVAPDYIYCDRTVKDKLIKELKKQGKTIILILHDLSQAVRISDTLVVMTHADFSGSIAMVGTPEACLQSHVIEDVFQTNWKKFEDNDGEYYFFE